MTTTPAVPGTDVETTVGLLRTALGQVDAGKIAFSDVLAGLLSGEVEAPAVQHKAVRAKSITDEHLVALKRLPDVYGVVDPVEPRALTAQELAQIVEEREVIDKILGLLSKRKDESIRETLANHLDESLPEEARNGAHVDGKGHYVVQQEQPVPGTGLKVQAITSDPKPRLDGAALLALYEAGDLSREDYLRVTKATRSFDEAKARQEFKKDPGLLLRLGLAIKKSDPTLTIKVTKA